MVCRALEAVDAAVLVLFLHGRELGYGEACFEHIFEHIFVRLIQTVDSM